MSIMIIRPGHRTRELPDGTVISPRNGAQPDPTGNVVVQYDEQGQAFREEVYPPGTTFDYELPVVRPAHNAAPAQAQAQTTAQGQNGQVTVPVTTTGALENVPSTRTEQRRGKIIAVLIALLLATLVGIAVYFACRGQTQVITVSPTPVVAPTPTLPKCSDEITKCKALALKMSVSDVECGKINADCVQ